MGIVVSELLPAAPSLSLDFRVSALYQDSSKYSEINHLSITPSLSQANQPHFNVSMTAIF
jgi:hypothetical protein